MPVNGQMEEVSPSPRWAGDVLDGTEVEGDSPLLGQLGQGLVRPRHGAHHQLVLLRVGQGAWDTWYIIHTPMQG